MVEPSWFKYYAKLPVAAQNVACSLGGLMRRRARYNKAFYDALSLLEQSQWWSLAEQRNYQDERVRELIEHAYRSVPYYREIMSSRGLKPADIRCAKDLEKLPILDKETVRQRHDDLLARDWPRKRIVHGRTGGTTGTALRFALDRDTHPWHWAVAWRHKQRFGLKLFEPSIHFAGRAVVPLSCTRPPIWRRNLAIRQTYVSVHHLSRQNMQPLVEYLQTRRVRYYSGYPSALFLVATYLLENGIRLRHPPRVTVTGSETVLSNQRRVIEEGLGAEVADHYGTSECCGNISECDKHAYHVDMELGVIEFLAMPGASSGMRRIVCTALHNPVMPLIRYDIGDIATMAGGPCPCGREAPAVERIDGRIESYITTPDGRRLGRLDFLFKGSDRIREAQLVQDAADHLTLRVVRATGYTGEDEAQLQADVRACVGNEMNIDLDYLAEIPREPNGKFRQIVSTILQNPSDGLREARQSEPAAPTTDLSH